MRHAALLLSLLLAACGSDGSDATASSGGCDDATAMSLCGCSTPVTIDFTATVVNMPSMGAPLQGIELTCRDETDVLSTSAADGTVSFTLQTTQNGCGYERCDFIQLTDPNDTYAAQVEQLDMVNGMAIPMFLTGATAGGSSGGSGTSGSST